MKTFRTLLFKDYYDTICDKKYYSIQPAVDSSIQSLNWYSSTEQAKAFHTGFSYSSVFVSDQTYYIKPIIDGKESEKMTKVELTLLR